MARLLTVIKGDALAVKHDVVPLLTVEEDYGPAIKLQFDDSC